jgi:lipopolysaccharide/colanic/teichoic acid biosynthesis glycosyltransferase
VIPLLIKLNPHAVETAPTLIATDIRPSRPRSRRASASPPLKIFVGPLRPAWYLPCKEALDFAAALALFVLTAPLVLAAALLVKLTSRGPAFYTQVRVGRHGRLFTIYKLRTMVHDCESLTGPRWAIPGDPRVTWVGRFLRLSHLDELPQLVNVLRGEMSLIGPRPERPEFVRQLERALPGYRDRLAVRPGVTGLAQLLQGPDTDLASVRRKLAFDLHYIRHLSPATDLRVVLCTALYVLAVPPALWQWLLNTPAGLAGEGTLPMPAPEVAVVRRRISA